MPAATRWTGVLTNDRKRHTVAQVEDLLQFEPMLLKCVPIAFDEGTDPLMPLVHAKAARRGVVHSIWSEEAHERVDVVAIRSLRSPARKLDQIGGRGLLGRHPASIPPVALTGVMHLMPGKEDEAAGPLDAYLERAVRAS